MKWKLLVLLLPCVFIIQFGFIMNEIDFDSIKKKNLRQKENDLFA